MLETARKDRVARKWKRVEWRIFARVFLLTFGGGLVVLDLFILLVDPFGAGRFPALPISGIAEEDPRTADAYRGRDPRFDSAIIGNSTGQLLSPARFVEAHAGKFVQLTIPGSGPREQLAVWHWFAQHHDLPNAIVLVADESWCTDDAKLPISYPFPFWLYADGWLDYGTNVFSMRSLDRSFRRLTLAMGLRKARDPTGYSDYELGRVWSFSPAISEGAAPMASAIPERDVRFHFPAIDRLDPAIAALQSTVAVIIVTPPVFFTALPKAGTAEATRAAACKRGLADAVAGRPRSGLVDMYRDAPLAHDPANFMDLTHYRAPVAKLIESRIAATLTGQPVGNHRNAP